MFLWNSAAVKERASIVARILKKHYPNPEIPLDHSNAFTLLIAVVLSAQCTDKRVNIVTQTLFPLASTPEKLAAMNERELYQIIRPCGLAPAKAKNLIATAKIILERHGGKVPSSREELEALPGVGRKTASVILSQAFGVPAFPVDTHIFRSGRRWGLSRGKSVTTVEKDLCAVFAKKEWNALHLRIIYYARNHCKAHTCKKPEDMCELCKKLGR